MKRKVKTDESAWDAEVDALEARDREDALEEDLRSGVEFRRAGDYYEFMCAPYSITGAEDLTGDEKVLLIVMNSWWNCSRDRITCERLSYYLGRSPEVVNEIVRSVEGKGYLRGTSVVIPRRNFRAAAKFLRRTCVRMRG